MSRKVEIVLGIIGTVIFAAFGAIIGIGLILMRNNGELTEKFYNDLIATNPEGGLPENYEAFVDTLGTSGMMITIVGILAVIAGIVAMILVKGNKKPKTAGLIFILSGTIVALFQFAFAFYGSVFYVIAGIMCLGRKPKEERAEF